MGDNETDELQDGIEEELPEQDGAEMGDGAEDEAQGFNDSPSYAAMVADEDYAHGTDSGALDTGDGFESDVWQGRTL